MAGEIMWMRTAMAFAIIMERMVAVEITWIRMATAYVTIMPPEAAMDAEQEDAAAMGQAGEEGIRESQAVALHAYVLRLPREPCG